MDAVCLPRRGGARRTRPNHAKVAEGCVAGIPDSSGKGRWGRLLRPPVEGKLIHGFEGADVGHRVRVQLVHTDVDRGYISTRLAW
ncbi:MAG: hypothetical protein ACYC37_06750 [Desulfobacteria bacterium]